MAEDNKLTIQVYDNTRPVTENRELCPRTLLINITLSSVLVIALKIQ